MPHLIVGFGGDQRRWWPNDIFQRERSLPVFGRWKLICQVRDGWIVAVDKVVFIELVSSIALPRRLEQNIATELWRRAARMVIACSP